MSKEKSKVQGAPIVSSDRLITIPGYVPNPSEGKFYVVKTDNVEVFKPFDPKKPKTAAKALYMIGKIGRSELTAEFIENYGNRIIVVSKKFTKLSKKHQLMLVERACFEVAGVPDRFTSGMENIEGAVNSFDRILAAELQLMEKYGYGKVKRLLKKENNINLGFQKHAGRYLFKAAKKSKKVGKSAAESNSDTKLMDPITLQNVEVAPAQ